MATITEYLAKVKTKNMSTLEKISNLIIYIRIANNCVKAGNDQEASSVLDLLIERAAGIKEDLANKERVK